jgi:hypothetical protein
VDDEGRDYGIKREGGGRKKERRRRMRMEIEKCCEKRDSRGVWKNGEK